MMSITRGFVFLALAVAGHQFAHGFVYSSPSQQIRPATNELPSFSRDATILSGFSFKNPFAEIGKDPLETTRKELKAKILEQCRIPETREKRALIEETIEGLRKVSPTKETATSPLLKKEWDLVWTTEKEINFFIERGWSEQITQTLQGEVLQNMIPFKRGGSLGVKGSIQADDINPLRTVFKFDEATLDLAKWGSYSIPPVGAGWFDTLYLDEDLRVDLNSRNDILICKPRIS